MNKYMKYLLAFLFLSATTSPLMAAKFIDGLEDVPVMEGLQQVPYDNISFGNEESRLVEAILTGKNVRMSKIETFYKETLPQMGWKFEGKKKGHLLFYRDRESLEIVRESKDPLTIRITVKSRN